MRKWATTCAALLLAAASSGAWAAEEVKIGVMSDMAGPDSDMSGAGSVLAFIEAGSGVKPGITGKPQPFMFNLALQRMGLAPEEVLAVGDRLDTDILGGQRAGCRTAVVLSGVATQQEVDAWFPAPDLVIDNLSDLVSMMQV